MNDYVIPEGWERLPIGTTLILGDKYCWEKNRVHISYWKDIQPGDVSKRTSETDACVIRQVKPKAKTPIKLKAASPVLPKAALRVAADESRAKPVLDATFPSQVSHGKLRVADETVAKPKAKAELRSAPIEPPKPAKAKPIELKVAVDKVRAPVSAGSPVLRSAPPAVAVVAPEVKVPVQPVLRVADPAPVVPVQALPPQVEFQVPHGWHLLKDEELIEEGDRWISNWDDDNGSGALIDWREVDLEDIGDTPSETTPCIRANARPVKAAPPKVEAPKVVECVIPSGWARLSSNLSTMAGDQCAHTSVGAWVPCISGVSVAALEANKLIIIRKIPTVEHVEPDVVVEKVVLKVASPSPVNNGCSTEKKECVNMSIPLRSASAAVAAAAGNGVLGGLFNTLKASAINATKTAASTTLAEKITDLVLARLPVGVRAMAGVLPRPVLIFCVSTAVYAAALKFDIPGRDRVRDISKYATDGSMYEAARLAMGLLEPLFAAIREMVPSDLGALINEAHQG